MATQPKVVLFGDSISSVVGYGQDSQADNRFGNSVADVVSSYLGSPVDSQAMGGVTTKDALTGSPIPYAGQSLAIPYGTYEKYLQDQRPDVVILRFGAADAIRLNDPQQTISNLQKMLDLAKQYGATPVLIGVSPFAAGGDSRAGNINAGSIDPYIASANQINSGIQQLAQQNQLPFVDMQRLEVPQGALLDGVHPTAEFGKQMADYIGQAVSSALPQFGGSPEKYEQFVQTSGQPATAQAITQQAAEPDLQLSEAVQQGLTQGGLEGVRKSYTKTGMIGDDIQTYEKIGETGSAWTGHDTTYKVYDAYGNDTGQTFTVSEGGLREGLTIAALQFASVVLPVAPGIGGAIGSAITQSLGISASAATNAFIGNTVIQAVLNGGDIESAVKSSVASWAGAEVGKMAGEAAKTAFSNPEGIKLISNVANQATQAVIRGGDVESVVKNTLVAGAVDYGTAKIPGFDSLPDAVKSTIKQSISAAVQGQDIDAGAMLANAAKEGLLAYGLNQIPQFKDADARTQSFITTMLRSGIDGGDLSESAIKWAVGQAQQEFQKVMKAGPALDELKKAGIISDASYYSLDDQQKELVDRLSQQKDPKAAAAQYINEQTTTPEEIRQFYKQITGKDATDADAELLSTFEGMDEATAKIGLDNQIRANIAVDEMRFEELNKVFSDPMMTEQDLLNTMKEYNITPAFVEKITGKKYDDIVRQMDARFMSQDEVVDAFKSARESAGLEPRDPTPDEILRYTGLNAGAVAQIQADTDREATTFDGSKYATPKEAGDAAKAAGYNNYTGPDGKTYMVSSPVVAIQAGAFDGTMFGSAKSANDAALAAGKETFVGPDDQIYRASTEFREGTGQSTGRVFDASNYDSSNPQQRMLAAYSAHKLGYKNVSFSDGSVFQLSDKIGESVAKYDQQVAQAQRLAEKSSETKANAFDAASFKSKGEAAIAANSAGKTSFVFSDGNVYKIPDDFAQKVMPNQTAAETKRLGEQNLSLVKSATDTAKKDFNAAWRAVVPFADPPAEGSAARNILANLIYGGAGEGVKFVTGLINGVTSIKLGAEPIVGYAGKEVEDARKYGVVISPYDSPEQRAAKFKHLEQLKAAGAKPLTRSEDPLLGPGDAMYDFGKYLEQTGLLNSPEATKQQAVIADFLKDVPWYEKPMALMAIANEGNWLGMAAYVAKEVPTEMATLLAGSAAGSMLKLGLSGKAVISAISDTTLEGGGAWQDRYELARSQGKSQDIAKLEGFVAAGVTMATELLPDYFTDKAVLATVKRAAIDTATSSLRNYAGNAGMALGTSFIAEYIAGTSNAAIMNKYDYGDWKWDDATTQGTIEAFVGSGTVATLLAGAETGRAIGYMKDGTVATVKDLLDRNPNVNYSTISRTEPLFNFSGNQVSLDQLTRVADTAVANPNFNADNFVVSLNDLGKRGETSSGAFDIALNAASGNVVAQQEVSSGAAQASDLGEVTSVNSDETVTVTRPNGSTAVVNATTDLKVGDSVKVNSSNGTAAPATSQVVSVDSANNTATVKSEDGTTKVVSTTGDVKVGDTVNTNQVSNTATVASTAGATTGTAGATTGSTVGTVVDTAGSGTVVDTTGATTGATAGAPAGAVTDTTGATAGTAADAAGTVLATTGDGKTAVVEQSDGSTAIVSTPGGVTVGDTVTVDSATNTASKSDTASQVTDAVVVDTNPVDGTATVVTQDGTKAVVDTAGTDVTAGSNVTVNTSTGSVVDQTSGTVADQTGTTTGAVDQGTTGTVIATTEDATKADQVVNTDTGVAVDTNTGVVTNPATNTTVDTNTGVATNQDTGVSVDTNTGTAVNPDTNTAVDTSTGTAVNTTTGTTVDTNTGVATNPNTNTAVDTNTGVATNPNTNTAVDTNTGVATNANTNTAVDTNTGTAVNTNTGTAVDTNTGVATNPNTNTAVDTNTGTAVNANTGVVVDTNTGVATNPNTNTDVDTNTGVATNPNTNTAVDTNTGVTTNVNPDTNTTTTVNPNTNTTTTADPNTNTQTTTDQTTGTTIKTNIEEPKEDPRIAQLQGRIDQLIQAGLDQATATSAAMSELTGQLTTLTQTQQAAQQAQQKAAQEAARQKRVQSGLQALAPAAGKPQEPLPTVSPLQTSGPSKFISPLAAFLAVVEGGNYAQPKQQQQQPMTPQPQTPDRYAYGKEQSIDELLDPYGEKKPEEESPYGFKAGGLATPLFAAGGGTRYGQYAKGGLNVVHHSGKARVDFRHGDAVTGPGDGQSDDIPAMLADGEFVWPADVVAALGNGSTKAGSDKLYDMMHSIRAHARSSGPKDLPPPAKSPLEYLKKTSKQKSARG
jgi:hypothetical protein